MVQPPVLLGQRQAERPGGRRVVAHLRVLHQALDGVQAEAVDAAVQPEPDHVLHRGHHVRVAPVQVGHLGVVGVQVPAPARGIPGPGRAAEVGHPVVRRRVAIGPHVVVGVLGEPRVLDRGVARHQVHQHAQTALVGGLHQPVEAPPGRRTAGPRRGSRRCRSPCPRPGRDRPATATARPRPGRRCGPGAARCPPGRRSRPRWRPGTIAGRPGRSPLARSSSRRRRLVSRARGPFSARWAMGSRAVNRAVRAGRRRADSHQTRSQA